MKKLIILFISILGITIFTGCSSANDSLDNNTDKAIQENNKTSSNNFEKYNILSFGEIEINTSEDYEDDEYIDIKTKVTNNSNEIIKTITIDFSLYEDENTILETTHPQESGPIKGNQSFYIYALYERSMNVKDIKINSYSYYIGDKYYETDLISKTVNVY